MVEYLHEQQEHDHVNIDIIPVALRFSRSKATISGTRED